MSRYNNLTIDAYAESSTVTSSPLGGGETVGLLLAVTSSTGVSYSTTISTGPIVDPKGDLIRAGNVQFRTQYPGGLYADASFFVARNIVDWWELNGATRIVLFNDTRPCYEGYITNFQRDVRDDGQGVLVRTSGATSTILMNYQMRKRWADTRISQDIIPVLTTSAADKFYHDRNSRIQIIPKNVEFVQYDALSFRYTMPTGETVKRVTYDYNLVTSSVAPSWRIGLLDYIGTVWLDYTERTSAGTTTGSADHTLGTPRNYLDLQMVSINASPQTPVDDGSVYGRFGNIVFFSETGPINMETIAKNLVGTISYLNSDTRFITAAGSALSLVPFMADNYESASDILARAASQGDGNYNRWAWYLAGSEEAFVPDGKPLLVLEQYPATSDYEYAVSLEDENLILPLTISQDFDSIANWITVQYPDERGFTQWRSPDDNAALKDDTSISKYGRRGGQVSIPDASTSTIADTVGQRYLATYKDPQYRLVSPIMVAGYIRCKGGGLCSASEIRAGKRVRIENYLEDVTGTGEGLTFVITQTIYNHDDETCQITTGVPETPLLPRYTAPPVNITEPIETGGGGGDGTTRPLDAPDPGWNWWERHDKLSGGGREGWLKMSQAERNKWKKTTWKKFRRKGGRRGE